MRTLLPCAAALLWFVACPVTLAADEANEKLFREQILPTLKTHCYECHSRDAEEVKGGLRLDTRAALREGGDSGEAIRPGDADASLLIKVLRYAEDDRQMPPRGKLDQKLIEAFERWVNDGADDPRHE